MRALSATVFLAIISSCQAASAQSDNIQQQFSALYQAAARESEVIPRRNG
ncbi:MAG TPA: hypothetical protein VGI22_04600 [Xanthobacteraceae bacterium]|jgi:hypothetical protein